MQLPFILVHHASRASMAPPPGAHPRQTFGTTGVRDPLRRLHWWVANEAVRNADVVRRQARYVLDRGATFEPNLRVDADSLGPRVPRCCFTNALDLAQSELGYSYCEGWAMSDTGQVVQHAWVTMTRQDAVEVTWPQPGMAYFGIVVDADVLTSAVLATHDAFGPVLAWLAARTRTTVRRAATSISTRSDDLLSTPAHSER